MRIAIVSHNAATMDGIRQMLQETGDPHVISVHEGGVEQLHNIGARADLVILDYRDLERNGVASLVDAGVEQIGASLILLGDHLTPEFVIAAMRIGIKDVLQIPVAKDVLHAAIVRIEHSLSKTTIQHGSGFVLGFIAVKSGLGATFLATNLAYALASEQHQKVILLDMNRQFGDALMFLSDHKPATTLADLARNIHRLDAAFLASSVVTVATGLDVLPAPNDPVDAMEVKAEHIEQIIRLAQEHYDFVLIDAGSSIDAQTIKALDLSQSIYFVTQISLPVIRDAKRLLDVFRTLDYAPAKVHLVVNRYYKGGDIDVHDLERSLGMKVDVSIPNHYDAVTASINQGIPVTTLLKSSPVVKALSQWAAALVRRGQREEPRWLGRMFGRHDEANAANAIHKG